MRFRCVSHAYLENRKITDFTPKPAILLSVSPLDANVRPEVRMSRTLFEKYLSQFCSNVIIMVGGQNSKKRAEIKLKLETIPDCEERVIIATGSYIG